MMSEIWLPQSPTPAPLPPRRPRFFDKHFWVGFGAGTAAGVCLCVGGIVALTLVMAWSMRAAARHDRTSGKSTFLSAPPFPGAEKADYDFKLEGLDGTAFDGHTLQGKVVVLNFWATWCGPCRLEMPSIERLYEKTKADGVAVLAVSDEKAETIAAFLKKDPYSLPVYRIAGRRPATYRSDGIPATFILSPDGRIAFKHVGAAAWDDASTLAFLKTLASPAR